MPSCAAADAESTKAIMIRALGAEPSWLKFHLTMLVPIPARPLGCVKSALNNHLIDEHADRAVGRLKNTGITEGPIRGVLETPAHGRLRATFTSEPSC